MFLKTSQAYHKLTGKQWRRLDRCDRMIQNESRDQNGGHVCLFSAAPRTSQCKLDPLYVSYAQIRFDLLHQRVASLASLSMAMAFDKGCLIDKLHRTVFPGETIIAVEI